MPWLHSYLSFISNMRVCVCGVFKIIWILTLRRRASTQLLNSFHNSCISWNRSSYPQPLLVTAVIDEVSCRFCLAMSSSLYLVTRSTLYLIARIDVCVCVRTIHIDYMSALGTIHTEYQGTVNCEHWHCQNKSSIMPSTNDAWRCEDQFH